MVRRHVSILISCEVEDNGAADDFRLCVAEVLHQHAMDITDPHSEVGTKRHGIAWYWDTGREVTVKWNGNFPKGVGFFARIRESWKVWRDDVARQAAAESKI